MCTSEVCDLPIAVEHGTVFLPLCEHGKATKMTGMLFIFRICVWWSGLITNVLQLTTFVPPRYAQTQETKNLEAILLTATTQIQSLVIYVCVHSTNRMVRLVRLG
jgi:hypothetical protein